MISTTITQEISITEWESIPLRDLLLPTTEATTLVPDVIYKQVTVKLWGGGAVLRGKVEGARIAATRAMVARTNQFILSRIDARNGAAGLIPYTLDGAVVSNDFPLFEINTNRILPHYLQWYSKTADFVALCQRCSEGTTNRVRLKVERFLDAEIPLPPRAEQERIVARLDAIAKRVAAARRVQQAAIDEAKQLWLGASGKIFTDLEHNSVESVPIGTTFKFRNDLIRPIDGKTGILKFIGLQHIESHTGTRIGFDTLQAEELTGRKFKFSPNEIVYGYLRPYLNKVWITDCDGYCSVDQYVLIPDNNLVDTRYLAHFMRSETFLGHAITLTNNLQLPRLRSGLLSAIPIPLPSIEEQKRVVAELDAVQSKVTALQAAQTEAATELDALMPAVLERAFRGKL